MNNAIETARQAGIYHEPNKNNDVKQKDPSNDFLHLLAQTSARRTNTNTVVPNANKAEPSLTSISDLYTSSTIYKAKQQLQSSAANETQAVSLEEMLKAKYPNLVYHVFDASSSYWRTRNDYPHYLLYQSGDEAKQTLENWRPTGANPFCGSIDGKFIAPPEVHALANVPPGSKAVVIHPKVQERMEQDPAYAQEIMKKIDTWFAFDVARNEAIMPGSTLGMNQAVAIGEDGNICNAVSSGSGYSITYSSDEFVQAYHLRMAKRAEFMRYVAKKQMEEDAIQAAQERSDLASDKIARSQLEKMLNSGMLREIFGETIASTPTETILAMTRAEIGF